jgi:hypothetical protein
MPRARSVIGPIVAVVMILSPGAARADDIIVPMLFQTANQSTWGPGAAIQFDFARFWGVPINESLDIGGFVLGTGAQATLGVSGEIGLQVGFHLDSGSVDLSYPVTTTLSFPGEQVELDQPFTLGSSFATGSGATLATTFPNIQAFADFVFDVRATASGEACAAGICKDGSTTLFDQDKTLELAAFNRGGDGEVRVLGANVLVGEPIDFTFGELTLDIPNINTVGSYNAQTGVMTSTGQDDFLRLTMDLDLLATSALGIPPLEGDACIADVFCVGYNILDAEAGPDVNIGQTFTFTPELMVTYAFSSPVRELDGTEITSKTMKVGQSVQLLPGQNANFTVTPTFALDNTFRNQTKLLISGVLDIDALEGSIPLIGDFGPVFSREFSTSQAGLTVFNNQWSFLFAEIEGESFEIEVVPEPGTLLLVATGVALAARRRRLARQAGVGV